MEFKEYMIKREPNLKDTLITVLAYILAIVIGVSLFPILMIFGGLALLVVVGLLYFAYHFTSRFKKEFEYIVTEDCIDIDVIMNKSKRKRLLTFNIAQMEIIASVKDTNYNHMLKRSFDKTIDATSRKSDANVYFALVEKNGKTLLKFEPPREMLEMIQRYSRSKVHICEE